MERLGGGRDVTDPERLETLYVRAAVTAWEAMHVHAIQHAVMAQAAARAYPDLYGPLGGTLRDAP
jgi:hypothetical protein